jgi:hypothetical protein
LLSYLHKAEVFLLSWQKKAGALNEPMESFELKVHLVAQPVGQSACPMQETLREQIPQAVLFCSVFRSARWREEGDLTERNAKNGMLPKISIQEQLMRERLKLRLGEAEQARRLAGRPRHRRLGPLLGQIARLLRGAQGTQGRAFVEEI